MDNDLARYIDAYEEAAWRRVGGDVTDPDAHAGVAAVVAAVLKDREPQPVDPDALGKAVLGALLDHAHAPDWDALYEKRRNEFREVGKKLFYLGVNSALAGFDTFNMAACMDIERQVDEGREEKREYFNVNDMIRNHICRTLQIVPESDLKDRLTEAECRLAASEESDRESVAMYHRARDRADTLAMRLAELPKIPTSLIQAARRETATPTAGELHDLMKFVVEMAHVLKRKQGA